MPRKNTDLTKAERIQLILDLFKVHHFMTKEGVDAALSSTTGIPINALKQSVYRDLNWLVAQGRLCVRHELPDGTIVGDTEQQNAKSYKSEWYLPESENLYVGSGLLSKSGAALIFSKRLDGEFRIIDIASGQKPHSKCLNIESRLGDNHICLSINRTALPFKIIIGRLSPQHQKTKDEVLSDLENSFGKRCIFLHIPIAEVSSYNGTLKAGHCSIEFIAETEMFVKDLNSTNHTYIIQEITVNSLIDTNTRRNFGKGNIKTSDITKQKPMLAVPPEGFKAKTPAIINCAERFPLLIYET